MTFAKITNAAEAWDWFQDHPALDNDTGDIPYIELIPVLVNPKTNKVNDNLNLNTKVEWWIETLVYASPGNPHNDYDLHCGGDTADEAIMNLCKLTLKKYGDYDAEERAEQHRKAAEPILRRMRLWK